VIQGLQEVIAVERVMFPRVFAIQCDEHDVARRTGILAGKLRNFVDQIVRGVVAMPRRVRETTRSDRVSSRKKQFIAVPGNRNGRL